VEQCRPRRRPGNARAELHGAAHQVTAAQSDPVADIVGNLRIRSLARREILPLQEIAYVVRDIGGDWLARRAPAPQHGAGDGDPHEMQPHRLLLVREGVESRLLLTLTSRFHPEAYQCPRYWSGFRDSSRECRGRLPWCGSGSRRWARSVRCTDRDIP